ncbi:MAG: family 43 glycosylhydrolase [Lachnospiraceae bacterium]|nr:family 43 glycosylhydrolase [Lachnospiraceae bacterium]
MAKVYVYTREVREEDYPAGLARSVHFASEAEGGGKQSWNRDYGILFASGIITDKNTICPMGVKDPVIFMTGDGEICICAVRVLENGEDDELTGGKMVLWRTRDLIDFSEEEIVGCDDITKLASGVSKPDAASILLNALGISDDKSGSEDTGDAADAQTRQADCVLSDHIEVSDDVVSAALTYWSKITCIGVTVPTDITVTSVDDIDKVNALISYSDGSSREKKVTWDTSSVTAPGEYELTGHITQQKFRFPLADGYGDPVIFRWDDKWYYISTNDNLDDVGFYVREADTVHGLFEEGIEAHCILDFDPSRNLEKTFWAPEFHVIGGELYILFAVSGHQWGPQCHLMKFRKGGHITDPASWEDPIRVVRADGTPLTSDGITLDMTYIRNNKGSYVIWSYRKNIMNPLDTGSMLYVASIDEKEPWRLTGEPVLLTRPLYGWENVSGTINNEGPYGFVKDGTVYVTYSGGSANAYTYVLGLLTADADADLTELSSWKKSLTPVLTFRSVEGEYGPGHNSFYTNEEGEMMIAYHGETDIKSRLRCDGIRRVHFRADGSPYFQMAASDDVPDMDVRMKVHLEQRD